MYYVQDVQYSVIDRFNMACELGKTPQSKHSVL